MRTPSLARFVEHGARIFTAVAVTFAPCVLAHDHAVGWKITLASAHAKEGNGGSNGDRGNGNGNNGNGNGDGGNSGGNGNGNSSANDNGESGNSGSGGAAASNSGGQTGLATGDKVTVQGNTLEVVHPDGITESIKGGRFTMKDARGRTIIDRAAKAADIKRLKGM